MSEGPGVKRRTEVRDGMRISLRVPIEMDDGIVLRADVYRPIAGGRYPVRARCDQSRSRRSAAVCPTAADADRGYPGSRRRRG